MSKSCSHTCRHCCRSAMKAATQRWQRLVARSRHCSLSACLKDSKHPGCMKRGNCFRMCCMRSAACSRKPVARLLRRRWSLLAAPQTTACRSAVILPTGGAASYTSSTQLLRNIFCARCVRLVSCYNARLADAPHDGMFIGWPSRALPSSPSAAARCPSPACADAQRRCDSGWCRSYRRVLRLRTAGLYLDSRPHVRTATWRMPTARTSQ